MADPSPPPSKKRKVTVSVRTPKTLPCLQPLLPSTITTLPFIMFLVPLSPSDVLAQKAATVEQSTPTEVESYVLITTLPQVKLAVAEILKYLQCVPLFSFDQA